MSIKGRKTKKCPRCGNECLLSQVRCDECDLLFSKVEEATNREGKKRLLRGQKEQVIFVKQYPKDVKKWKLILITIFLGLFGGHYLYVGRRKAGFTMLLYFFVVVFVGVIFNAYFLEVWGGNFYSLFGPLTGVYCLIWLNDIRRVCFNSFKIPVSIISEQEDELYLKGKEFKKEHKKLLKKKRREERKTNHKCEEEK